MKPLSQQLRTATVGFMLVPAMWGGGHPKGPEKSTWTHHTLRISGAQLSLSIPGNLSKEFHLRPIEDVTDFDLNNTPAPSSPSFPSWDILDDRFWEYRGPFWEGRHGSLQLAIAVEEYSIQPSRSLMDLEYLKTQIHESWVESQKDTNRRMAEHKATRTEITLPINWKQVSMGGTAWWCYEASDSWRYGNNGSRYFEIPISRKHTLKIFIHFVDAITGRGTTFKSDWRQQAEAVVEKILSTVKLEIPPTGIRLKGDGPNQ